MFEILQDRVVIKISGESRVEFFQGLLTKNSQALANQNNAIYTLMLTPQGKYLFDFFIVCKNDALYLDIAKDQQLSFLNKLNLYKLRAKVEFTIENDLLVVARDELSALETFIDFIDPRSTLMGRRAYCKKSKLGTHQEEAGYHLRRITNLIPEGYYDMVQEKSFPLEYGFDKIGTIDFDKGCYVGQELITRTYHRGTIRKALHLLEGNKFPEKGKELIMDNKKIGIMASAVDGYALAILRLDDLAALEVNAIDSNYHLIIESQYYRIIGRL